MRRILICLTVASLVSLGSVASATTMLSYQDTTTAPGDVITYTLSFGSPGGGSGIPDGTATLTIRNSANVSPSGGDIYVGAIVIHMDGGTAVDITPTSPLPASWNVSDDSENSDVKIIGGGGNLNQSVRQRPFAGFYSTTVDHLATGPDSFDGLLCVTCTRTTYTFTFDYTGALETSDIPFQAIYYDGGDSPTFTGILSETLGGGPVPPQQEVPELGTLLLLGSGFAALGSARLARRRRLGSE